MFHWLCPAKQTLTCCKVAAHSSMAMYVKRRSLSVQKYRMTFGWVSDSRRSCTSRSATSTHSGRIRFTATWRPSNWPLISQTWRIHNISFIVSSSEQYIVCQNYCYFLFHFFKQGRSFTVNCMLIAEPLYILDHWHKAMDVSCYCWPSSKPYSKFIVWFPTCSQCTH